MALLLIMRKIAACVHDIASRKATKEQKKEIWDASYVLNATPILTPHHTRSGDHTEDIDLEAQVSSTPNVAMPETRSTSDLPPVPSTAAKTAEPRPWYANPQIISDACLGLSDGLTVPFALSAGLSALGSTRYVILGGLAELIAGAISMGFGGLVGVQSEAQSYARDLRETKELVKTSSTKTQELVRVILAPFGLSESIVSEMNESLHSDASRLEVFLMKFHHESAPPWKWRAYVCGLTLAISYFVGGLAPLIPYFFVARHEVDKALYWSVGLMGLTLFGFGYCKTCVIDGWVGRAKVWNALKGGGTMLIVGVLAAGSAVGLVRLIDRGRFIS